MNKNTDYNLMYRELIQKRMKKYIFLYFVCTLISALGLFMIFSSIGILLQQVVSLVSGIYSEEHFYQILLFVFLIILIAVLSGFAQTGFTYIEQKVQTEIRTEMIIQYLLCEERIAERLSVNEIMNRISYDLPNYTRLAGYYMSGLIYQPVLSGLFSMVFLLLIDWRVLLLCLTCSALSSYSARLFTKKRKELNKQITDGKSNIISFMCECMDGGIEIRTLSLQTTFQDKLRKYLDSVNKKIKIQNTLLYMRNSAVFLTADCITILGILIIGGYLSKKGMLSFADVMIAIPLSDQIGQMVVAWWNKEVIKQESMPYYERIKEIYELKEDKTHILYGTEKDIALSLKNICHSYDEKAVFHNLSCFVSAGKKMQL